METKAPKRTAALCAAAALALASGAILYWALRQRAPPTGVEESARRPKVTLDPDSIRFPPLEGPAKEKLSEARRLHREALSLYRKRERIAGDEAAKRALGLYAEAGALVPELSGLHYEILVTLIHEGRYEDAVREARTWLQSFPEDFLHRETLAKAYFQWGRYPECAEELRGLVRRAPRDTELLRMLVQALLMLGAKDEAIAALEKLLRIVGLDPPPKPEGAEREGERQDVELAAAGFLRFQEHGRALPYLERLRRLAPTDRHVRFDLATTLRSLGRVEEALALLEPLGSEPDLGAEALVEAALCLGAQNRHRDAAGALCRALEADPTNSQAYRQLAQALRRLGKLEDAAKFDEEASSLAQSLREKSRAAEERAAGKAADAICAEARSLDLAGRIREADSILNEPRLRMDPILALHRARMYLGWLRGREAAELAAALLGTSGAPRSEAARLLAQAQEIQGLREEAKKTLRSLLAADSGNEAARGDLARLEKGPDLPENPALRELYEIREWASRTPWPKAAPFLVEIARRMELFDHAQAIRVAQIACAADPRLLDAWRALGRLLREPAKVFYRLGAWKNLLALAPEDEEARRGVEDCRKEIARLTE